MATSKEWSPQLALAVRYRKAANRHRARASVFDEKAADLEIEVAEIRARLADERAS